MKALAAGSPLLVIDTDVVIDYLRDQSQAVDFLEGIIGPIGLSPVTVAELYVGVRDGEERGRLDGFIKAFALAPLTQDAAVLAGLWRRHFPMLTEVLVPYVKT